MLPVICHYLALLSLRAIGRNVCPCQQYNASFPWWVVTVQYVTSILPFFFLCDDKQQEEISTQCFGEVRVVYAR